MGQFPTRWPASIICFTHLLLGFTVLSAEQDSVFPMPAWASRDIGGTGRVGDFTSAEGGVEVRGAGADIWRESDSFQFVHARWEGDGQWIVRVLEVENTDPWAKAGLMVREDLSETARHASVLMTPGQGAVFIRRNRPSGSSLDDSHQAMRLIPGIRGSGFQQRGSAGGDSAAGSLVRSTPPRWLKLVRRDDVFAAFDSTDGITWEWLGTDRIPMQRAVYVGLAVTSHDNTRLCSAVFGEIRFAGPDQAALPSIEPRTAGAGTGLKGAYFNSRDHTGASIERIDSTVNFDWVFESPVPGITADGFSVRWEGELEALFTEPHAFQVLSDDRARLWINGELIIDEWYEHAESKSTAVFNLEAGSRYLVRLDYFENRGRAMVKFLWSSPSIPLQIVPQAQLHPEVTDEDRDGLPDLWEREEGLDPKNTGDALQERGPERMNPRQQYRQRFAATLHERKPADPLPGSWLHQDVGRVGVEGAAQLERGVWTVAGSGADVWANSDGFHYAYQTWRGDGEIVARVVSQQNTDPWARAGIMWRATLEGESKHVMAAVTPENGVVLLHRSENSDVTSLEPGGNSEWPVWLKIVRSGNVFSALRSVDGRSWEWIGTEEVVMPDDIYVGLAVNSHDNSALGRVEFQDAAIRRSPPGVEMPSRRRGDGTGLIGVYLDSATGTTVSRLDPSVNFDWDRGSPAEGIGADHFSVRWEGSIEAVTDEVYALHLLTDDGARLWINDKLLIDAWSDRAATQSTARIPFKAGERHAIKLEFYEREQEAVARLLWSTPTIPRQPIPQSQLYPTLGAASGRNGGDSPPRRNGDVPAWDEDTAITSPDASLAGLAGGITGVSTVLDLPGAAAVDRLGRWEVEGAEIYAVDRRGALEYDLQTDSPDVFRIEIEGTSQNPRDLDSGFRLIVTLDGEILERTLLDAGPNRMGRAHVFTPYLQPGTHRLHIFWDNARKGRSLRIRAVRVQALAGPDTDGDGIKDWVETRLEGESGVEIPSGSLAGMLESVISPACVEGRGRFLSMMSLNAAGEAPEFETSSTIKGGEAVRPRAGAGDRWFANIPLLAGVERPLTISYQNGGLTEEIRVRWTPVDLRTSENLLIRQGDSLLLTVADAGPLGSASVEIEGGAQYSNVPSGGTPHRFDSAGSFQVRGTWNTPAGVQERTIAVKVLAAQFPEAPAAWVGKTRRWDCPDLPEDAVLDADRRLSVQPLARLESGGRALQLTIDAPEPRTILVRTGRNGPVLASARVDGFQLHSAMETDIAVNETFSDGSERIEMGLVMSPVIPGVRLQIALIVGGVLFDDGKVLKELASDELLPLGESQIHFIRPAKVRTSVCHKLTAWQGGVLLGTY